MAKKESTHGVYELLEFANILHNGSYLKEGDTIVLSKNDPIVTDPNSLVEYIRDANDNEIESGNSNEKDRALEAKDKEIAALKKQLEAANKKAGGNK